MSRILSSLLVGCLPLLLAGCGDGLNRGGTLGGRVTIDGEPVTAGYVLLISEDGRLTASAPLRGDGTYVAKEPPLGKVKIAVQTLMYRGQGEQGTANDRGGNKPVGSAGMVTPDPMERGLVYKAIPEKYEEVETSGLTHVVERGDKKLDLQLTAKQ